MPGDAREDDAGFWFTPPWETEDAVEPPGPVCRVARKASAPPEYDHPLLTPLAAAQDALARVETKAEMASNAVAEGLRARMAFLEAAGWLRRVHVGVHPYDLALRDNGLTTSYGVAARLDRLSAVMPSTFAQEAGLDVAPDAAVRLDIEANQALRLARQWRRLGDFRSWRPLADVAAVREAVQSLGGGVPDDAEIADWLSLLHNRQQGPMLIRAGRAAATWMNLAGVKEQNPDGFFLAACVWREKAGRPPIVSLPFWSAPELRHHRLELHFGTEWMADFLDCVRAAAITGLQELERLRQAEEKARKLGVTARSRLPDAVNALLRAPVVTANSLAQTLKVTPQAALGLLRQLMEAEIVRETTGRNLWRAFSIR